MAGSMRCEDGTRGSVVDVAAGVESDWYPTVPFPVLDGGVGAAPRA